MNRREVGSCGVMCLTSRHILEERRERACSGEGEVRERAGIQHQRVERDTVGEWTRVLSNGRAGRRVRGREKRGERREEKEGK